MFDLAQKMDGIYNSFDVSRSNTIKPDRLNLDLKKEISILKIRICKLLKNRLLNIIKK
jgi:hypothetical protein